MANFCIATFRIFLIAVFPVPVSLYTAVVLWDQIIWLQYLLRCGLKLSSSTSLCLKARASVLTTRPVLQLWAAGLMQDRVKQWAANWPPFLGEYSVSTPYCQVREPRCPISISDWAGEWATCGRISTSPSSLWLCLCPDVKWSRMEMICLECGRNSSFQS